MQGNLSGLVQRDLEWGVQALADPRAAEYMKGRKVMEINPDHPIVKSLNENYGSDAANAAVHFPTPYLPPQTGQHQVQPVPDVVLI